MVSLPTTHLLLSQSRGDVPQLLLDYETAGGEKDKLIIFSWPYPYVDDYEKLPLREKLNGFEVVSAAVEYIDLEQRYIQTDREVRISFEELVISPWDSPIAERRGLLATDKGVTFCRTVEGGRKWLQKSLSGICSPGQQDTQEAEQLEHRAERVKRIEAIRAWVTAGSSLSKTSETQCDVWGTGAPQIIKAARRRTYRVVRATGVKVVS